uniref:CLAVATA3/ESR (CLE)-related protein n=1 Tax=Steinernema glaseri TaxID=37863 RepID=A0A1I7YU25_9BILA
MRKQSSNDKAKALRYHTVILPRHDHEAGKYFAEFHKYKKRQIELVGASQKHPGNPGSSETHPKTGKHDPNPVESAYLNGSLVKN